MGLSCSLCQSQVDPELEKILNTVSEKSPDIINNCVIKKQKIDDEFNELLEERKKKVEKSKDKSESELEELLKEYNKKEVEKEKELIANEVDKMHSLWELGLDLSNPLKNYIITKLTKKLNEAPSFAKSTIDKQINEVKAFSPKEFLNSTYGKPLKDALIKQGMSASVLKTFKEELLENRKNRRKEERNQFSFVKKNEFPPEDEFEINVDDLYEAIFDEYKEDFQTSIKKKFFNMNI